MADRVKGLTIVLGADTSELVSAIHSVNTAISKTQTNLRDINKALKLDPGNVSLLKDKQNELATAIDQAKQKLEAEKEAMERLEASGVDKTSQEFRDLKVQIDLDESALKQLEKQMKDFGTVGGQVIAEMGRKMQEVGDKIKAVGDKISSVGQSLTTTVTLPIVAAGTAAVTSFAEVDKTMTLANQTMENSAEQASLLNKAMEEAAANSTFGMNDAANASLNFARAGLKAGEAANAMAPAMNLAAGEAGDLDVVSSGLVATINGFGDDFKQAEHYADVFAVACNKSALDVNSLSESMSVAAPIFNTAGKDVEDAALMLGVMANAGIEANVAANSLKTGMARLAQPTKQAKEAMEQYGIAMSDIWNEDGSMKDMTVIQKNLNEAFSKLSEQEQMAAAGAIFGKNQMASWLAVINTAPTDVQSLADSLSNVDGTTREMANAMMSGFGGSIEKLKSSLDVLVTSLGSIIAEYLTPVIEKIQGVIDMFMAMDEETKKQIVTIAGIVAAIGPVLLVGGKIISGIGTIISVMGTVTTFIGGTLIPAITAISAPVLAVVAAVAALAAGFVYLYKTNDDFRNKVNELISGIKENFGQMIETIKPALDELFTTIKTIVGELVEAFKQFMKAAEPVFEFIATGIAGVINGVMQAATPIINAVNSIIKMVSSVVKGLFSLLTGDFKGFASNMKDALKSMLDAIKSLLEGNLAFFKGIFETFGSDIGAKAMQWGIDLINNLVEGIKSMIDRVGDAISDVADVIASFIHFSEPDQGSLANFNSFMPDMMRQMASGITKGIPMVENAMDNLTKTMVPTMGGINVSGAGGTNNNISNAVSINVYGAQGQDVNALAEIIQDKINSAVYNRGAVFA